GPDAQMKILDFGIGSLLAETEGESLVDTMSTANSVNSGLDCASPESIMDPTNLTPTGDQYSLGCVLYFFLTGSYPFPDGTAVEQTSAHRPRRRGPTREINPGGRGGRVGGGGGWRQKRPAARWGSGGGAAAARRPSAPQQPPRRRAAQTHTAMPTVGGRTTPTPPAT